MQLAAALAASVQSGALLAEVLVDKLAERRAEGRDGEDAAAAAAEDKACADVAAASAAEEAERRQQEEAAAATAAAEEAERCKREEAVAAAADEKARADAAAAAAAAEEAERRQQEEAAAAAAAAEEAERCKREEAATAAEEKARADAAAAAAAAAEEAERLQQEEAAAAADVVATEADSEEKRDEQLADKSDERTVRLALEHGQGNDPGVVAEDAVPADDAVSAGRGEIALLVSKGLKAVEVSVDACVSSEQGGAERESGGTRSLSQLEADAMERARHHQFQVEHNGTSLRATLLSTGAQVWCDRDNYRIRPANAQMLEGYLLFQLPCRLFGEAPNWPMSFRVLSRF